ncbi:hypothetical protein NOCA1190029 [metagenome]|uniref:Uncharacterized protein n=1 Tax=metagenome TaxID=256318 RepID=A0A2P2CCG3_9ZZZZ
MTALTEKVGLDSDLVGTLAQTYQGAAEVVSGAEVREGGSNRKSTSLIRWGEVDDVEPASRQSRVEEQQVLRASLLVASAAYWLLLEDADAARRCYVKALDSTALSSDDRVVLSLCASRSTPIVEPVSEYSAALGQLARFAGYDALAIEDLGPSLPSFSSPVLGVDALDLWRLSAELEGTLDIDPADESSRSRIAGVDAQFRAALERGSRPIELARLDWRWSEQVGPLLPVEPELLSLALIYVSWSARFQLGRAEIDEGVADATVRAAQLLLDSESGHGRPR